MSDLVVEYIESTLRPKAQLTFGRSAELILDADNGYLHRQAGRFRNAGGIWWLDNRGSRLRLKMVSNDGSVIDLQAGASAPLAGLQGTVSLEAGPTRYELCYRIESGDPMRRDTTENVRVGDITATYGAALTAREVDFVIVLAQNRLTGRGGPLPSQEDVATAWGVSKKTVDNTLQRLRSKLRASGVRRIDTSETLVDYLVAQGFITIKDLEWARLEGPEGPRTAGDRPPEGR
jgi:hypothetical protein